VIDGTEILTAALEDFGTDATINDETLRVIPHLKGGTALNGDVVDHVGPFAEAFESAVDALETTPTTGNNGDTITILGRNFTLLSIDPDEDGGVILTLEETS